jgi:hypothetical protein
MVVQQQFELLEQVRTEEIGPGQRGLEPAGARHKAITQVRRSLLRNTLRVQPHKRVAGAHAGLLEVAASHKLAHRQPQVLHAALVDDLDLRQGGSRVAVKDRSGEIGCFVHGVDCDQAL